MGGFCLVMRIMVCLSGGNDWCEFAIGEGDCEVFVVDGVWGDLVRDGLFRDHGGCFGRCILFGEVLSVGRVSLHTLLLVSNVGKECWVNWLLRTIWQTTRDQI